MFRKNKRIFLIFYLVFLTISFESHAQNPFGENQVWKTNIRVDRPFSELILTPIDSLNPWEAYFRIEFTTENTFRVYNIPGCGMDCVISSYGSYSVLSERIKLTIDSTFRYKACSGETHETEEIGTYFWVKDDYSLRLVKTLEDEPQKNYFEALTLEIPKFKTPEANELSHKFVYLYNRLYPIIQNNSTEKYGYFQEEIQHWRRVSNVLVYGVDAEAHIDFLATQIEMAKIFDELQKKMIP